MQGNLWVEYIPTPEQVEYMMYPRILALAEVAWSAPERKSWRDFHARALKAVRELQAKGYHPFDLKNEIGSRPESVKPVAHLALSKKVIYNSSYSPHYPAQGNTALTDGIRGDWTYGDRCWQGFIDGDRLDVIIDMETVTPIHSVTAAFMQVTGAEVFLPESVTISVSDDGTNLRNWNTGLLKSPKKFLSNLRTSHGRGMLQEDTFAIRLKPEKNSEAGYSQMR